LSRLPCIYHMPSAVFLLPCFDHLCLEARPYNNSKATLILFVGLRIFTSKCKWGREKKTKQRLCGPKAQILTVGHYCDLKMVVSRAQFLFEWSPCTTVYRFDGRFKHLASARLRFQ
jgi:hypothetical protein